MLLGAARTAPDRAARIESVRRIKDISAPATLVLRLATTTDPLVLWALHLRLHDLGVPPCQRWPSNTDTPQAEFITLLADLLWLHRHLPDGHQAKYKGWRDLLAQRPPTTAWHEHALRQYLFISRRGSIAHWCAEGLALTDAQRADTMMLPTAAMRASRRHLQPKALAEIGRQLLDHATTHPDRAGRHQPHAIAARRLRLWRCWALAGESPGRAASHWALLTGEALTRQRVTAIVGDTADLIGPATRRQRRSRT